MFLLVHEGMEMTAEMGVKCPACGSARPAVLVLLRLEGPLSVLVAACPCGNAAETLELGEV
jgi:hypothetical protein